MPSLSRLFSVSRGPQTGTEDRRHRDPTPGSVHDETMGHVERLPGPFGGQRKARPPAHANDGDSQLRSRQSPTTSSSDHFTRLGSGRADIRDGGKPRQSASSHARPQSRSLSHISFAPNLQRTQSRQDLFDSSSSGEDEFGMPLNEPSSTTKANRRPSGKLADPQFEVGNCMTCDSKLRWPKELTYFRCTVCQCVNDLTSRDLGRQYQWMMQKDMSKCFRQLEIDSPGLKQSEERMCNTW